MKTIESLSLLGLTFFGLTSDTVVETRTAIFRQIHQIVFHGKGGYDWETVYNMPIWLRRFTFNEIQQYYDEEKKAYENQGKSNSQTVIDSSGKIQSPEFLKGNQGKRPVKYN